MHMSKKSLKMFPNPDSRARTQYFLNKDSSNKYSCETSQSQVPDWKYGEGGGDVTTGRLCLVITKFGFRVHLLSPVSLLQTFFGNSWTTRYY